MPLQAKLHHSVLSSAQPAQLMFSAWGCLICDSTLCIISCNADPTRDNLTGRETREVYDAWKHFPASDHCQNIGYGSVMRRVVVTGLGAVTPLGVGVRRSWSRLLAGESGIVSTTNSEPQQQWHDLPSTVAGIVPKENGVDGHWHPNDWLTATEQRRMSTFTQYAMAAAAEALKDSGWRPVAQEELEATGVCLGSGIGNLEEIYNTSITFHQGVSLRALSHGCVIFLLTTRPGLQEGLATICAKDPHQYGSWSYCYEIWLSRTESFCNYGVHHWSTLNRGRVTLHCLW